MTSQILGAYVCTTPDQKKNSIRTSPSGPVVKNPPSGRSQDGGGVGLGDHFLFYKFIERTTER